MVRVIEEPPNQVLVNVGLIMRPLISIDQDNLVEAKMHFCTYFDINYIHRGLALYNSLERQASKFTLWILCFDDRTYGILESLNLPNVRLIQRREFEAGDNDLLTAQQDRSTVEYYWTCTPSLPLFILKQQRDIETICYVDADIFFFSSPQPVFDALNHGSIFIVPHDFAENKLGKNWPANRFNVGVMVFRRDENGLKCLRRWRAQCIEWCRFEADNGKWGDQGYLDDWPQQYKRVIVSEHPGIHAGPWNIRKYRLDLSHEGVLLLNGDRLVCYHFHGLSMITPRIALIRGGHYFMNRLIRHHIYQVYVAALSDALQQLYHEGYRVQSQLNYPTLLFLTKRFLCRTLRWNVIFA